MRTNASSEIEFLSLGDSDIWLSITIQLRHLSRRRSGAKIQTSLLF